MSGVAMDTKMGRSYACIFLRQFEYNKLVPGCYKRCIDDIIGVTSTNYSQVLDCIIFLKNFHHDVKFTYQVTISKQLFEKGNTLNIYSLQNL